MKSYCANQNKSNSLSRYKSNCENSENKSYQKFPNNGSLKENINKDLKAIKRILSNEKPTLIYAYVLTTVKNDNNLFRQTGSAPNFQGDHVTLCTCMHHMRCFIDQLEWENQVWVAGMTGGSFSEEHNYLFYLMKVSRAFPSQYDLWYSEEITNRDREKKSSQESYLGDLYVPKNNNMNHKRNSAGYHEPMLHHSHRQNNSDNSWIRDIEYYHKVYKRHPSFLLGDPDLSFLWKTPKIKIEYKNEDNVITHHPRTKRYDTLDSFLEILK